MARVLTIHENQVVHLVVVTPVDTLSVVVEEVLLVGDYQVKAKGGFSVE